MPARPDDRKTREKEMPRTAANREAGHFQD